MKIKSTIHNYNCPICGYTIKQENELLYILISMCLFPFTLLYCITLPVWSLVKNTINKKVFFDLDIKKIGDKVKKCPVCKREVCIKIGTEWIELSINEMKIWAYRTLYRIIMGFTYCAFLMLVVNIVFFQAWFSTYGDKIFAMTLFFILLALIIVILVLCFCWKKLYNKEYILLNKKDFSKVQQSLNRLFSDSENFHFYSSKFR